MGKVNFRIKKYQNGWAVEIEKERNFILFKRRSWVHFISVAGIESMPWYFKSKETAMQELLSAIRWDTLVNSMDNG